MFTPRLSIQTLVPSISKKNKSVLALLTVHHPNVPTSTSASQKRNIAFAIDVSGSMSGALQGAWKEVPLPAHQIAPLFPTPHPRTPQFIATPVGTPFPNTPWNPNVVPMVPEPFAPGLPGVPYLPHAPTTTNANPPTTHRVLQSKLDRVKQAVSSAIDTLESTDTFSIVVFDANARILLSTTQATATAKENARALLLNLNPGSSTALHAGWSLAAQTVAQTLRPDAVNRVLLLTDGEATDGIINPEMLAQHTAEMASHGISTSTFGVGDHFNENLLQAMAESGDGRYVYLETAEQYDSVFRAEFQGLAHTYGRAAQLHGTTSVECDVDFLNDLPVFQGAWKLPNPQYNKTESFLIKLTPKHDEDSFVITMVYNCTTPTGDQMVELHHTVHTVSDKTYDAYIPNDNVAKKQLELETARAKTKAMAALDRGDIIGSRTILAASANVIAGSAYAAEFATTSARLGTLMATTDSTKLRKMASYDAYSTRTGDTSQS